MKEKNKILLHKPKKQRKPLRNRKLNNISNLQIAQSVGNQSIVEYFSQNNETDYTSDDNMITLDVPLLNESINNINIKEDEAEDDDDGDIDDDNDDDSNDDGEDERNNELENNDDEGDNDDDSDDNLAKLTDAIIKLGLESYCLVTCQKSLSYTKTLLGRWIRCLDWTYRKTHENNHLQVL